MQANIALCNVTLVGHEMAKLRRKGAKLFLVLMFKLIRLSDDCHLEPRTAETIALRMIHHRNSEVEAGGWPVLSARPGFGVPRPSRVLCEKAGRLTCSYIPISAKELKLESARHIPHG